MIFYQLIRHCAQKHPYPPPESIAKQICWRYLAATCVRLYLILIFILSLLGLSAESCKAQNITITSMNEYLRTIMTRIEQQSGYDFWYNEGTINESEKVTINLKNQSLETVLRSLFKPRKLGFEIVDKTIFIKPVDAKLTAPPQKSKGDIEGVVLNKKGHPIAGAAIKIKETNIGTSSDEWGRFKITGLTNNGVLIVSSLGYKSSEMKFSLTNSTFTIVLEIGENQLEDVQIVSTGYQSLSKERATGSFILIDSAILNRRIGTNILDRLDGVTSGLIFNRNLNRGNTSDITIRGRSTIFANTSPLIVLDNFPYDGDINNINPNDIEDISILKDAAAASIWGVRAGNGVIVIKSKKGKLGQKTMVSINSSIEFSASPDLHYQPQMSVSEYIELEQFLFRNKFYDNTISNGYGAISDAVAIMLRRRNGQISSQDSLSQVSSLKDNDVQSEYEKYIYQPSIKQQYALNIKGGTENNSFFISTGYNRDIQNTNDNEYNRFNFTASNKYFFFNKKLRAEATLALTSAKTLSATGVSMTPLSPYERFADASGKPLSVVPVGGLRQQYTDTAGNGNLLDWKYRPLDENYGNATEKLTDYRLNTNVGYTIIPGLEINLFYQYQKGIKVAERIQAAESFSTRNMINVFSKLNRSTGMVTRPVPIGDILNKTNSNFESNYGRIQLNYNKTLNPSNSLTILAGYEIKDYQDQSLATRLYGYDATVGASLPVDYLTTFPLFYGTGTGRIASVQGQTFSIDRFRSAYVSGTYSFKNKYILSASARKDESNLFGVKANQKGVPLWSVGTSWKIDQEKFYNSAMIPKLSFRASFGYNGNLDRSTTAYLTSNNLGRINLFNIPFTEIVNPPNPSLRWERVRNINFGIDFGVTKLISGSLDYFIKEGIDLIGNSPIAPQTGVVQYRGNSANTRTSGLDLILTKNLAGSSMLNWSSTLLLSYNREIITSYKVKQGTNQNIISQNYVNPLEGYPYYSIFSFPFTGLDNTGAPQGSINGQITKNYQAILNSSNPAELIYNGSATPTVFGSFRNELSYKRISLSFNLVYKFNYYFRRNNVFSGVNYTFNLQDYSKRWQTPGDENLTLIPALTYPNNSAQQAFFQGTDILVEKGDHIRLQDIRFSYRLDSKNRNPLISNLTFFAYANNIGVLWKVSKQKIDPDYAFADYLNPRTLAIGLTTNF